MVTRNSDDQAGKIVLTHLADVLAGIEGDPIDVSLFAYFKRLFPKVNPPVDELRQHKRAFLEGVPGLVNAYGQFKQRWGEPATWDRGQLLAILLMSRYPTVRLEDLWCDEQDREAFVCHAVRLLRPGIDREHLDLIRQIVTRPAAFSPTWRSPSRG